MFEIKVNEAGDMLLSGRFDASQVGYANQFFDKVITSTVVDFKELDYISSAGLSVLLVTQKRLSEKNQQLKLMNMNRHIQDVFRYAGFDKIFVIA
ncbi:STAS domain-containing protein [candidate division KSB1 bacterium]|nr:STAS domain-containing protein [candidate division KSB1 bacterium]